MWFSLAAEQGDEDARFRRDRLTAVLREGELARAEGALRGYREATAPRGPEPSVPKDDIGVAGPGGTRAAAVRVRRRIRWWCGGARGCSAFRARSSTSATTRGNRTAIPGPEPVTRSGSSRPTTASAGAAGSTIARCGGCAMRSSRGKPAATVVREIQTHLRRLGYRPGAVDGRPGPRTRAAVEDFQRARGLPVDGRLSLDLMRELRDADR